MSCCIKRQLFIRKLDIRTVYVKEIEIFREISLFFFALVEKGDVQMKQYIGIKVVAARPMTRGDYNIFRGRTQTLFYSLIFDILLDNFQTVFTHGRDKITV